MKIEHLSSVEKTVAKLLAAKDLAATCITSFKWDIINQHSMKFKSAWQLSGFFVKVWGTNICHLSRKKSPNCLQLKTWWYLYHLIQTEHDQSTLNKCKSAWQLSGLLWRDEERTPLICREKVNELLAAKDLAATCMTLFKWDMINEHSVTVKVHDTCRGFVEG